MKVRIKEYINRSRETIRYKVQYLWLGFIWRTFDDHTYLVMAIRTAKELEAKALPKNMTITEAERQVEQEKKEQE